MTDFNQQKSDEGSSAACEHGKTSNWWWDELTVHGTRMGGWAGPLSMCGCCGAEFGFLEGGWTTDKGMGGQRWEPRNRCGPCGGKLVPFGDGAHPSLEKRERKLP